MVSEILNDGTGKCIEHIAEMIMTFTNLLKLNQFHGYFWQTFAYNCVFCLCTVASLCPIYIVKITIVCYYDLLQRGPSLCIVIVIIFMT